MPIMAARLQGEVRAEGVLDLSLWGAGRLGRVRFSPLAGPYLHAPNRLTGPGGGVYVAQGAPVVVIRGARLTGLRPARRRAAWDATDALTPVIREGPRAIALTPWGAIVVEARAGDLVVAVGADAIEAEQGLALSVEAIVGQADAYVARCDVLAAADPELRSMALQGAHAALSSVRRDVHGRFLGLSAGEAYSIPARTYYRDGYWTCQALLRLAPEAVGEQIDLLALGLRPDGQAPSGLILAPPRPPDAGPVLTAERPLDWWSDHFDSPLLFVLLLADHARATADRRRVVDHWPRVRAVFERYQGLAARGGALPLKPRNDRDWADNVFREGLVAYDLGLWIGALDAIAAMGEAHDPSLASAARRAAAAGRAAIEAALWRPAGWYADYASADGFSEDHLALDSLTLLRFGGVPEPRARQVLAAVRARLESRHNRDQPWGDWGVLCAWPPYRRRADLRAKSAFALRYHNGGDWPWLDGLYAAERLRRGLAGWRYPMLAWWRSCLARGWPGAVEHLSPPFGRGSLLQAWSSLPLAVALEFEAAVLAGDADAPAIS
jgi:hypothetical protein